jgi:putative YhdH/YhfP family quinone oxidoreductase
MELCGQTPDMGEVVVSGASGGVGSMAIAILHKAGYKAVASSGKQEQYGWLKHMGASSCIDRSELDDDSGRPLLSPQWAGAIDTVGGNTLATLLKRCNRNGSVAACGLVASPELRATVFPFILNGINLLGVDSAETPYPLRKQIWHRLSSDLKPGKLNEMGKMVALEDIPTYMDEILNGEIVGRIIADMAM